MSWSIFRNNVIRFMSNRASAQDTNQLARVISNEYKNAVFRGRDIVNGVSISKGNSEILERSLSVALKRGLYDTTNDFSLVNEFGYGIVSFWQGAVMNSFPIPIIPAAGSFQNIQVVSNVVINAGVYPQYPAILPSNSVANIVDKLILSAVIHLFTVSGIIQTVSLYSSVPSPISLPGIIMWRGYFIPLGVGGVDGNISNLDRTSNNGGSLWNVFNADDLGGTSAVGVNTILSDVDVSNINIMLYQTLPKESFEDDQIPVLKDALLKSIVDQSNECH